MYSPAMLPKSRRESERTSVISETHCSGFGQTRCLSVAPTPLDRRRHGERAQDRAKRQRKRDAEVRRGRAVHDRQRQHREQVAHDDEEEQCREEGCDQPEYLGSLRPLSHAPRLIHEELKQVFADVLTAGRSLD